MGAEFFLHGWGLGFTVYVVLQVMAVLTLTGGLRRRMALLPAPAMILVLAWTIYAERTDSNLWPMFLIFASPPAAIAVAAIWLAMWRDQSRERKKAASELSG